MLIWLAKQWLIGVGCKTSLESVSKIVLTMFLFNKFRQWKRKMSEREGVPACQLFFLKKV